MTKEKSTGNLRLRMSHDKRKKRSSPSSLYKEI